MSIKPAVDSAHDVAAYILGKRGSMTAMKLQKLLYYCQAWSLVWDERPMFPDPIEAWANGPVVKAVYQEYQGMFEIERSRRGDPDVLDKEAAATVNAVLKYYGGKKPQWLSNLTHIEAPWCDAREGLSLGERGNRKITLAVLHEYYGSL